MTTPSQARIDAALRLAEACDKYAKEFPLDVRNTGIELHRSLADYRATLPKLRTRAEVDAEKTRLCEKLISQVIPVAEWTQAYLDLSAEPTAPEPTAPEPADETPLSRKSPACSVCHDKGYTDDCTCTHVHSCKVCQSGWEFERNHPHGMPRRLVDD